MSSLHFFALPEDWPPILGEIEEKAALQVVLAGRWPSPEIRSLAGLMDIPNLGEADAPRTIACAAYLIAQSDSPIKVRQLQAPTGDAFFVDQLENPDAIMFTPAGRWTDNVIIAGTVGTAHETPRARSLMKSFRQALSGRFRRFKGAWLGEVALAKWHAGCRLTSATQSPPEYDLQE